MTKFVELPEIETARLILRKYLPEDADALLMVWTDPDLSQYFPPSFRERNKSEMQERIARIADLWQTRGYSQWGVLYKNSDELVGYCGLQMLDKTSEVELYYGFRRNYWGQGLATEATRAAVRYGFEEIKLTRLTALTFPQNIASQKILQKLGFQNQGTRVFYQSEVYYFELLRQDFERYKDESFYRLRQSQTPPS